MEFKISSAVCTGRYHIEEDTPCQDAVCVRRGEKAVCVALADGAGSRANSDIGATCVTQHTAHLLSQRFDSLWDMERAALARFLVEECLKVLEAQEPPMYEMASTLLFFAAHRDGRFLTGHLGDGVQIQVLEGDEYPMVVSHPENGQYQNETIFLTADDAQEHFRIQKGMLDRPGVFLMMSDGMAESLYLRKTGTPAPACGTIARWLAEGDEEVISQALVDNMKRTFSKHSGDDLSLAAIGWS